MAKYTVEITETLQKRIEVEAANRTEALSIANKKYIDTDIILDDTALVDYNIDVVKEERSKEEVR